MPKYYITKPVYFSTLVEADDADAARDLTLTLPDSAWEADDPQPLVEHYELMIEEVSNV